MPIRKVYRRCAANIRQIRAEKRMSIEALAVLSGMALAKVLQEAGANNAKYTELPGLKHDIEARVFAEPDLFAWIFSFKK